MTAAVLLCNEKPRREPEQGRAAGPDQEEAEVPPPS